MTASLEKYGLKKESETPAFQQKQPAYNVVLASEAQLGNVKFFVKRSRHAFNVRHKPKVYVTSSERMHARAR